MTEQNISSQKDIKDFKGIHAGQAGWLLGNSSSLNLIDNEKMKGRVTFVCNEALFKVYQATYGVTGDRQCYAYMWNYQFQTQNQFPKAIFFYAPDPKSEGSVYVDQIADVENGYFSRDLSYRIVNLGSPVYLAAQLAVWMGCNPIFVLGNDLRNRDPKTGDTHFWGSKKGYFDKDKMNMGEQFDNVYGAWKGVYPKLTKMGVHMFSVSPWSQCNDFMPYISVEEALKM